MVFIQTIDLLGRVRTKTCSIIARGCERDEEMREEVEDFGEVGGGGGGEGVCVCVYADCA